METKTVPSTAELEARVLAGKTVTAAEFADAANHEAAQARIEELTDQRQKQLAAAAEAKRQSEELDVLEEEFREFVVMSDEQLEKTADAIPAAIAAHKRATVERILRLNRFADRHRNITGHVAQTSNPNSVRVRKLEAQMPPNGMGWDDHLNRLLEHSKNAAFVAEEDARREFAGGKK